MQTLTINFGGFYESWHSDIIDNEIDQNYCDDSGEMPEDFDYSKINYKALKKAYCKRYLSRVLSEYLDDEYGLKIIFGFECLDSPRFYNFETDVIQARTTNRHHVALLNHFKKDFDFLSYLKEDTKSREGFHSFYNFDMAINNKDNILHVYILKFVCEKINRLFDLLQHEPFLELINDVENIEL